jgi:hypothetical protein
MLFSMVMFIGCDNSIEQSLDLQKFVLNTYIKQLPGGVDSIQRVSWEHPFVKNAVTSQYLNDKDLDIENLAIYYYTNNKTALLAVNKQNNTVYAYVTKSDTKDFVDVFVVMRKENPVLKSLKENGSQREVQLISSVKNKMIISCNGNKNNIELRSGSDESWGGCMKNSMEELYDDWENDAWGSFCCWMTGPLCAVGAAIHCL